MTAADSCSDVAMEITFLKPTPSDITWNALESVKVVPSPFMN